MSDIKKAVTSDAAPVDETQQTEAELEGTSNPTIQEAKTPSQAEAEANEIPEPVASEPPKEFKPEPKPEPSFGSLFKPFKLGSTLEQTPSGNVVSGIKKPAMDYVKMAQEATKNIKLKEEDFKSKG